MNTTKRYFFHTEYCDWWEEKGQLQDRYASVAGQHVLKDPTAADDDQSSVETREECEGGKGHKGARFTHQYAWV